MQSNTTRPNSHRQLLMHNCVTNRQGQVSARFVAHSEHSLWRFLLEAKHGLGVQTLQPCIWVPQVQCRRHDKLFAHSTYQHPVTKLTYQCFDEHTGVAEKRVRFVPTDELDCVNSLLEAHFAAHDSYVVADIEAGEALSTMPAKNWFKRSPTATYRAA